MIVLETPFWDHANVLEIWFGKERKVTKYDDTGLPFCFFILECINEGTGD